MRQVLTNDINFSHFLQHDTTSRNEPKSRKRWKMDDPFQYAPPKPDGEPWTTLLEPPLKMDKIRCDAWKDEVQNLLIFVSCVPHPLLASAKIIKAGLFSAVVTAFVIESYKTRLTTLSVCYSTSHHSLIRTPATTLPFFHPHHPHRFLLLRRQSESTHSGFLALCLV